MAAFISSTSRDVAHHPASLPEAEKRLVLKLASRDHLRNLPEPEVARALFLACCTWVVFVSETRTQMIPMTMTMMQRCFFVGKHAVKRGFDARVLMLLWPSWCCYVCVAALRCRLSLRALAACKMKEMRKVVQRVVVLLCWRSLRDLPNCLSTT